MKAINTRKISIVLITFLTIGLSHLTTAFSQASYAGIKNETPVEFKFLSKVNSQPLFQLNMNNSQNEEFLVNVKDGSGAILYSEKVKGINILRQYLLSIDEDDFNSSDFKLRFEVIKTKTHEKRVYNVTRDTRIIEDILIAKL